MTPPGGPPRRARDLGAATLESVGATVVAALVVVALLVSATVVSPGLGETLRYWVCQVTTPGQGGCAPPSATADARRPTEPCVITSDGGTTEASLGVAVVVDGDETWTAEQLGDGTWRLSRRTGIGASTGVGPSAGLAVEAGGQTYGGRVGASAGASGFLQSGETYVVPDDETAADYLSRTRHDDVQDALYGDDNFVRDGVDWLTDHVGVAESELPEPDSTFVEVGAEAEVRATGTGFSTSAGAGAGVRGQLGTEIRRDGTSTVYVQAEVSADASGSSTAVGDPTSASAAASAAAGGSWEIDYDAQGSVVAVRLISESRTAATAAWTDASGEERRAGVAEDSSTRTTLELPTQTAADRAVVADVAAAAGIPHVPGLSDRTRAPDPLGALAATSTLVEATLDHGRLWQERYSSSEETDFALTVEAGLIGEYGGGGSYVSSSRTSEGLRYYDGRGWTAMEGCSG